MFITVTSVMVDDRPKALDFYTRVLRFAKKTDVPLGDYSWLTVVSSVAPEGVELLLEPDVHPAAKVFKAALVADGIPFTSFGVVFVQEPTSQGPVTTAVFDDTCGNLIQIAAMNA